MIAHAVMIIYAALVQMCKACGAHESKKEEQRLEDLQADTFEKIDERHNLVNCWLILADTLDIISCYGYLLFSIWMQYILEAETLCSYFTNRP